MPVFSETVEIRAAPSQVWEVWSDVARWPEWTASVSQVDLVGGFLELGAQARIRQPKLGPAVWVVTDLDPPNSFTWVNRRPGLLLRAEHKVLPANAGAIAASSFFMDGPAGGLAALTTGRLVRRYLQLEGEGLKRRCEQNSDAAEFVVRS